MFSEIGYCLHLFYGEASDFLQCEGICIVQIEFSKPFAELLFQLRSLNEGKDFEVWYKQQSDKVVLLCGVTGGEGSSI